MLQKIRNVLAVLLVIAIGWAAAKPDTFRVERSIHIAASPAAVYPLLEDFREWSRWSPWEASEPNMKRTFGGTTSGVGTTYSWEGTDRKHSGRAEVVDLSEPYKLTLRLVFYWPFEAHNMSEFSLVPQNEGTKVIWSMFGSNEFLGRLLSVFVDIDSRIGKDFELGLANLKAAVEN